MKAVSPVIATLILIAIAVIAGIFVLRQFLFMATTSGTQHTVYVTYRVLGTKNDQTVSQNVRVM